MMKVHEEGTDAVEDPDPCVSAAGALLKLGKDIGRPSEPRTLSTFASSSSSSTQHPPLPRLLEPVDPRPIRRSRDRRQHQQPRHHLLPKPVSVSDDESDEDDDDDHESYYRQLGFKRPRFSLDFHDYKTHRHSTLLPPPPTPPVALEAALPRTNVPLAGGRGGNRIKGLASMGMQVPLGRPLRAPPRLPTPADRVQITTSSSDLLWKTNAK